MILLFGGGICEGCGTPTKGNMPSSTACESCPPTICDECGGTNHLATGRACACWVALDGMAFADIKALFAADGTFNLGMK